MRLAPVFVSVSVTATESETLTARCNSLNISALGRLVFGETALGDTWRVCVDDFALDLALDFQEAVDAAEEIWT